MLVILSQRGRWWLTDVSRGNSHTIGHYWQWFYACCHGDRRQPGPVTVTPLLLCEHKQTVPLRRAQLAVWSFLLIAALRLFPLLLQRKESFRTKECCWLRGRKRWGQMGASQSLSERGGREGGRKIETWRPWDRNLEGGGVVGDISNCCKCINYYST